MVRADRQLAMCVLVICAAAAGCEDEPEVYACRAKGGATCEERYGETREDADALCTSSSVLHVGSCPTRNLIGRCEKPGTALGKETYVVKSYYGPMPNGWDVNRMQGMCAKGKGRWLAPGNSLSMVPSKLAP